MGSTQRSIAGRGVVRRHRRGDVGAVGRAVRRRRRAVSPGGGEPTSPLSSSSSSRSSQAAHRVSHKIHRPNSARRRASNCRSRSPMGTRDEPSADGSAEGSAVSCRRASSRHGRSSALDCSQASRTAASVSVSAAAVDGHLRHRVALPRPPARRTSAWRARPPRSRAPSLRSPASRCWIATALALASRSGRAWNSRPSSDRPCTRSRVGLPRCKPRR